jgi:CheY-like chemotaxis protein
MDQRRNAFLATLAHELRNPLAPIRNGLQLLELMQLGDEAETVRAMMVRQVEQIVHLVDGLLDVARVSSGKILLDKQICMISDIVNSAIEESSILILENSMTLEVTDKCAAACVCGDPSRLTQVVCNLLNNAAKFGKCGGRIQLEMEACDGSVFIRIRDDGIGIDTYRLHDIFEMYSQVEGAHRRGLAGLGIGLSLVRTFVELHNGLVTAESDGPDCGSTFTVKLPIATGGGLGNLPSKAISKLLKRPLRVLLVDDMRAMRIVTERLLQKLGHEVQVAENGEVALEKMNSFLPDVVLSDITMPVMGGYDLARCIRNRPELDSLRLVAMTGYGQSSDREIAFDAGFDCHLTKPADFQVLQALFDDLQIEAES